MSSMSLSIELTIKDGLYKITTLKSILITFTLSIATLLLVALNNYYNPVNDHNPSELYLI
jgi:hypothetical protein